MADFCELLTNCPFFIVELKPGMVADEFKRRYCDHNKEMCARYMIARAKGLDFIPDELYPNEYDRALEILYGTH